VGVRNTIDLDPLEADRQQAERRRRLNVVDYPAARLAGNCLVLLAVLLHNLFLLRAFSWPAFVLVSLGLIGYSLLSWLVLYLLYARVHRIDLGDVFLVADVFAWILAIYASGGERSWLFFLMIIRAADQRHGGTRRVLGFAHLSTATYALLLTYVAVVEHHPMSWSAEFTKVFMLYAANLYLATTSRTAERLRMELVAAIRLARQSIEHLGQQTIELEEATAAREKALATVRESEQRTRAIIDTALDAVISMDAGGVVTGWNSEAERMFGWLREDVVGRPLASTIIPERFREAHQRGLRYFLTAGTGAILGKRVEQTALHRDGREFPVELAVSTATFEGGVSFNAFVRDITERKQAESVVASERQVLEMIATGATPPDVLAALCRVIEGRSEGMLCSVLLLDPDGVSVRHGAAPSLPLEYVRAIDGASIGPCAGPCGTAAYRKEPVIVSDISTDPLWADCRDLALRYGLRACWSTPILSSDGSVLGTFAMYYHEARSPGEAERRLIQGATHIAGIVMERSRAEAALRQSEAQLRQAQKMEAVGQLAGGIAHDFNNLLTVIAGRSQLLLSTLTPDAPQRRGMELIGQTAQRAATLVRQLLAFSRKQVLQPRVLDLTAVATDLTPMLQRLIGENIDLIVEPGMVMGRVTGDRAQLEQVITNLAVNARDAMPEGGRLTIETADAELDATFVAQHPGARPGPHVMLAVSDTGSGMSPEVQARAFEPFFTTKEVGKGTGLGLAMVYGIVKQHSGYVFVESEVGRGSRFRIYLPRTDAMAESQPEPSAASVESLRGTETILLVEDEAEVRAVARESLTLHGYTVLEARDVADALEIAEVDARRLDLLITDVVMPQMNGRELAERVRALHRETRVLYISGYTDDAIGHHGVLNPGTSLLAKPFTPSSLAHMAREVLEAREG
jgi:two-component system, cell cycle sensor histidine kinase and response regulator CckA